MNRQQQNEKISAEGTKCKGLLSFLYKQLIQIDKSILGLEEVDNN